MTKVGVGGGGEFLGCGPLGMRSLRRCSASRCVPSLFADNRHRLPGAHAGPSGQRGGEAAAERTAHCTCLALGWTGCRAGLGGGRMDGAGGGAGWRHADGAWSLRFRSALPTGCVGGDLTGWKSVWHGPGLVVGLGDGLGPGGCVGKVEEGGRGGCGCD